jgi:hypothetical protein
LRQLLKMPFAQGLPSAEEQQIMAAKLSGGVQRACESDEVFHHF